MDQFNLSSAPRHRNLVLNALEVSGLHDFRNDLAPIALESGAVLYEPGRPILQVYFPLTAVLSIVNVMKDGRTVESDTVGCESVVGVLNALGAPSALNRTFVQIAGDALVLDAATLKRRAQAESAVMNLLIRFTQANLAQAHQSVACNALHPVHARLCRWLLLSHDRTGADIVPLTQDYLATMLGVQRTTVTQAMTVLKTAGCVDYRRGKIHIADRAGLEALACECYAVGQAHLHWVVGEAVVKAPA